MNLKCAGRRAAVSSTNTQRPNVHKQGRVRNTRRGKNSSHTGNKWKGRVISCHRVRERPKGVGRKGDGR